MKIFSSPPLFRICCCDPDFFHARALVRSGLSRHAAFGPGSFPPQSNSSIANVFFPGALVLVQPSCCRRQGWLAGNNEPGQSELLRALFSPKPFFFIKVHRLRGL